MPSAQIRSFKIPKPVDRALLAEADRRGTTRTAVVVEALRLHLGSEKIEAETPEVPSIDEALADTDEDRLEAANEGEPRH